MRAFWFAPLLLSVACATGGEQAGGSGVGKDASSEMSEREWQGPAITCEADEAGGVHVGMTAPTAGHTFAIERVDRDGATATVWLLHEAPRGFVAQVITPLGVDVDADQLGDCRTVELRVRREQGAAEFVLRMTR